MTSIRKGWRLAMVAGAAALAFALVASAFAQAPPSPPHEFYGDAGMGSAATIDGEAAGSAMVTATNQDGEAVGSATTDAAGSWTIQVNPADASSVTFSIAGGEGSAGPFDVSPASFDEVTIAATSGDAGEGEGPSEPEEPAVEPEEPATTPDEPDPVTPEQPSGLPNTGSGGLADTSGGFPLLPVALTIAALIALGGVAATRRARIGAR